MSRFTRQNEVTVQERLMPLILFVPNLSNYTCANDYFKVEIIYCKVIAKMKRCSFSASQCNITASIGSRTRYPGTTKRYRTCVWKH